MPSTLSARTERIVQDMVRVAGGEQEFEEALAELRRDHGPSLTATQIMDYLLKKRIEELKVQVANP